MNLVHAGNYLHSISLYQVLQMGFPGGSAGKESACNAGAKGEVGSIPGLGRFPWRKNWQPTPVFLPGESHGQRNLAGYSLWGRKRVRHNLMTKQQKTTWIPCIPGGLDVKYRCILLKYSHLSRKSMQLYL